MGENEHDAAAVRGRSIRTLAWIGDAEFERELRFRLARRGDYPTDRLDRARAKVSSAHGQARLLQAIEPGLDEAESAVVRRARNSALKSSARATRDVKSYRAATALEALVAHWALGGASGRRRFESVLVPPLELALDAALAVSRRPVRG